MQMMRPLAHFCWPGLDVLFPRAILVDVSHATGNQNTHHLGHIDSIQSRGHQKVDDVLGIGQVFAVVNCNRHLSIVAPPEYVLAGSLDVCRIRVQAMHQETVVGVKRCGQRAVTAAEVYDHSTLDPRLFQNLGSVIFACRFRRHATGDDRTSQCREEQSRQSRCIHGNTFTCVLDSVTGSRVGTFCNEATLGNTWNTSNERGPDRSVS